MAIDEDDEDDIGMEIDESYSIKKKKKDKDSRTKKVNKIESESSEEVEEEIYCICRTTDIDRFMIACDKCEEWFHGDCVGVRNKKAARKIEEWYCPNCLKKHDDLEILYKIKEKNEELLTGTGDKRIQGNEYNPAAAITLSELKETLQDALDSQNIFPVSSMGDSLNVIDMAESQNLGTTQISENVASTSNSETKKEPAKRMSRQCGECPACVKKDDCGHCDFCLDMRKFGGLGRLRQKCRTRQCFYLSRVRKKDGIKDKSLPVSLSDAIRTEHQYTKSSYVPTQTATTDSTMAPRKLSSDNVQIEGFPQEDPMSQYASDHCYTNRGPSPPINVVSDDPDKDVSQDNSKHLDNTADIDDIPRKKTLKVKRVVTRNEQSQKPNSKNEKNKKRRNNNKTEKENAKKLKQPNVFNELERLGTSRVTRSSRREKEREKTVSLRQCFGPACVNPARNGSKYCSTECGIQLQINEGGKLISCYKKLHLRCLTGRIQTFLPIRRKEHDGKYHANILAEEKLKEIQETQKKCKEVLLELDNQYKALEELIERSKGLTVLDEEQKEEEKDHDIDLTTYCVSCGVALAPRIAYKHMEKCWAKFECLMSFGAQMKSVGNLFCDAYQQGTYCKRLKIMCAEHYKEKKVEPGEVCGCPLTDSNYKECPDNLCRVAKRKCNQHVSWERLRKGEIDLKRVHQWWKLEDAYEQERHIRIEMSQRNNLLAILLNQTIDHTKDNKSDLEKYKSSDSDNDIDVMNVDEVDEKSDTMKAKQESCYEEPDNIPCEANISDLNDKTKNTTEIKIEEFCNDESTNQNMDSMMTSVISDGIIVTDPVMEDINPVLDDTDLAAETIDAAVESNKRNKQLEQATIEDQANIEVSSENTRISVFNPSLLEKLGVSAVTIEQAPKTSEEFTEVTEDVVLLKNEKKMSNSKPEENDNMTIEGTGPG